MARPLRSVVATPCTGRPGQTSSGDALATFYQIGLRYLILTALRTGEVRFATIDEIDRDAVVHAIPAERTKTRTARRVPLSSEALAVLDRVEQRRTGVFLLVARERANRSAIWQCSKSYVDWRLG